MKITNKDVQHIANLARINLAEDELQPLAKNLEDILGYIKQLDTLDISDDIKPMSHPLASLKNVYRKDEIKSSLSQEEALSIAIAKLNGAFKVPQIIE
jgi:aspartyl-tRNA(Asn)/glutamyl-tRNA(Gln) amidotransferase subunit C